MPAAFQDGRGVPGVCRCGRICSDLLTIAIEVLRSYAAQISIQPGDILTIGETPVAVIQGRYRHPERS